MSLISLSEVVTVAQYAIAAVSRYRAAPAELASVRRDVDSFKILISQIQRINARTTRGTTQGDQDLERILQAAKMEFNQLIQYLNRYRQLGISDRFSVDANEINARRIKLLTHYHYINGYINTLVFERLGQQAAVLQGRAEGAQRNEVRERQDIIRTIENAFASYLHTGSGILNSIESELRQEGLPVDRLAEHKDIIGLYIRDLLQNGTQSATEPQPVTRRNTPADENMLLEETMQLRLAISESLEDAERLHQRTADLEATDSEYFNAQVMAATQEDEDEAPDQSEEDQYADMLYNDMMEREAAAAVADSDAQLLAMGFTEDQIMEHKVAEQALAEHRIVAASIPQRVRPNIREQDRSEEIPVMAISRARTTLSMAAPLVDDLAISNGGWRCCKVQDSDGTSRVLYIDSLCGSEGRRYFLRSPILEDVHVQHHSHSLPSGWLRITTTTGRMYYEHAPTGYKMYQHPRENTNYVQEGRTILPYPEEAGRNILRGKWIIDDPDAACVLSRKLFRAGEPPLQCNVEELHRIVKGESYDGMIGFMPLNLTPPET